METSTKTAIARRSIEKTSATMATTEQVQEALQQLQLQEQRIAALEVQLQVEQTRTATAEQELQNSLVRTGDDERQRQERSQRTESEKAAETTRENGTGENDRKKEHESSVHSRRLRRMIQ